MNWIKPACLGLALAATGAANAFDIDVKPAGGMSFSGIYGDYNNGFVSAMGQTFTVDSAADTQLNEFAFYGQASLDSDHPGIPKLTAYVYAWQDIDASSGKFTGSPLFMSAPVTLTTANMNTQKLTFTTGGIALQNGKKYVAFVTSLGNEDQRHDYSKLANNAYTDVDPIKNGDQVRTFARSFAELSQSKWVFNQGDNRTIYDLAFVANFSSPAPAVPEPETYAMMAAGLGVVGWSLRKRKSA